jgi:uncharacterized protein
LSRNTQFALLAIVGFFAISGTASAAGFDCARAKSPREQLICREPVLSDLDEQLGRVYQERRAVLSPRGAELLHRSELSWLHFVAVVCPLAAAANAESRGLPKDCLIGKYKERLNQLATVGQKFSPFLFNRIDSYAARPAPDSNSGWTAGFYVAHVAYPQIDNLDSPQVDAWNKLAEKGIVDTVEGEDSDTEYEIGYANEHVISVQWTNSEYVHGNAHGIFTIEAENKVLFPDMRDLAAEDLFGKENHWVEKFQEIFWNALLKKGWEVPENQPDTVKAEIVSEVIIPGKWLFTKEGIQVSFSAYEGGCYACNPGPVTASWTELEPLLSSTAIVP